MLDHSYIADLTMQVNDLERELGQAQLLLDDALSRKFIAPWTRRKLESKQIDLNVQKIQLQAAQQYLTAVLSRDPETA